MSLLDIRGRPIVQIVAACAAAGWVVLEGLGQFIERGLLPESAYRVGLVWYVCAVLASIVIGWYHGEKGSQKVTRSEVGFLGGIFFAGLAFSGSAVASNETLESSRPELDPRRVAVRYFTPADRDSTSRYLGDAFTEALIRDLASVRSLDVVSRNGVAPFRHGAISADSVARAVEAGTVVDGSVRTEGDRLRVELRLLNGDTGEEFRRGVFEWPESEWDDVQEGLSDQVALWLRERLGEEVRLRTTRSSTENAVAWRLFQRAEHARKEARRAIEHGDPHLAAARLAHADSLAGLASEQDPAWVEAPLLRAELAYERSRASREISQRLAWIESALEFLDTAIGLAPGDPRVLASRGRVRYWKWLQGVPADPAAHRRLLRDARRDLERAVELDPSLAEAHYVLSHLYYQHDVGDVAAAVLAARRAYEEDAYLSTADATLNRLFNGSLDLGQFRQARRWCEEGARRFPRDYRFVICRLRLMSVPGATPDIGRAWLLLSALDSLAPAAAREFRRVQGELLVSGALAMAGAADSAVSVLRRADQELTQVEGPVVSLLPIKAHVWILLGDHDRAIDVLKEYVAASHGFGRSGDTAWWWQELRDHPRFQELTTRH